MENQAQDEALDLLAKGVAALRLTVDEPTQRRLWVYAATLLKWNDKVNLTAITKPSEVVEKHLLDSLAALPEVSGSTLMDLGAGGGLPGIPLAIAMPDLQVTMVDAVGKKVAFMKNAIAAVGLGARAKAVHLTAEGRPDKEQLPCVDTLISRALMAVGPWLLLARHYVKADGRIVAMMGQALSDEALDRAAGAAGLCFVGCRRYALPFSSDPRAIATFRVSGPT